VAVRLADLKSPFTHGHSGGVAALARGTGLLHDVGRVAVADAESAFGRRSLGSPANSPVGHLPRVSRVRKASA
jgi:hypothetical protein